MKMPFRFFRGEFNGSYLYNLVTCPNLAVQEIIDELVYHTLFQWKLGDEVTAGETAIRNEDVLNIGKIAGLFQPRVYAPVSSGSIGLTQNHAVNGAERSERGLMDMDTESFRFVREEYDDYPDDIDSDASGMLRMSLVPEGTVPAGYVRYDTPLFDSNGDILWENVLPAPPADGAPYSNFYGEKYLIHEEVFNREMPLSVDVYKPLLECAARVRHNGPSLKAFLDITRILGDGYMCDLTIVPAGPYYVVHYRRNPETTIQHRERRFAAWNILCAQKFKLFKLEEDI
jgi:hypothetical protein